MELEKFLDVDFKKSRFSHTFSKGAEKQLYHSILMKPLLVDQEAFNVYSQFEKPIKMKEVLQKFPNSRDFLEKLISERHIVSRNSPTENPAYWENKVEEPNGLGIMYLLPTDRCNFRCKYCFLEGNMDESYNCSDMEIETAKKGIDFFADNCIHTEERPNLIFYGGEPLLKTDIVLESIKYAHENYPDIRMSIVTNGSLISKGVAEVFAEHDLQVGISIDGPKEIHDSLRIGKDGKGTYDSVLRGYNLLKQAGCENLGVSLTLASHNVPNLKKNVESLVKDLSPISFGFNLLLDTAKGNNPYSVPVEQTTDKMIEAFKFLRQEGIFEDRMMRKIKPFMKGIIHLKDCGAPGNQIVLAPKGDIGPCQAFLPLKKYFSQNVHSPPLSAGESFFGEWVNRYPLKMDDCTDCEALGVCGGGCPYNAYINTGSIQNLDERMCTHNKKFLNWVLWDVIDSKKNVGDKKEK